MGNHSYLHRKPSERTTFSRRLSEYIAVRGFTEAEMARFIGINKGTIGNYLRYGAQPNAAMITKICAITGISADWWLGLEELPLRKAV